jgi:hypothetical protein
MPVPFWTPTPFFGGSIKVFGLLNALIATGSSKRCGTTTWGYTPPTRGLKDLTSQRIFDLPGSCKTNTPLIDLRFSHGCEPRTLRVPLLPRLFWFVRGGNHCTCTSPIATSRFADFIALACPGETWSSPLPLLRVWIQVSASGGSSTLPPDHVIASRRQILQHCSAKHCFQCSECDEYFITENARDQVHAFGDSSVKH